MCPLVQCCIKDANPPGRAPQVRGADVPPRPAGAAARVHAQHRRAARRVRGARPDHALLPHAVLPPLLQVRLLPAP